MAKWYEKLFSGRAKEKDLVATGGMELLKRLSGTDFNNAQFMDQYGKSLYVFACVSKIAQAVGATEFELYRIINSKGDVKEVDAHPGLDLIYKVNPFQTKTEFLETTIINLKLSGNAFWLKVRNNGGQIVELWNMRPDYMTVVTDPEKFVKEYIFRKSDGTEEHIAPEDVVHFKYPDPLSAHLGMSPLKPAQVRVQTEAEATKYQRDFFLNSARPDAVLKNSQTTLTKDQKDDIREGWAKRHQGVKNAHRIAILEGGLEYQQIAITQKDMEYIEGVKATRDDILVAFQVPKIVLSIVEDVNRANAETGMYIFLSQTVKPELTKIVEKLNEMLIIPEYGEDFYMGFVDPTPTDKLGQLESLTRYTQTGIMLVNEAREELGLEPIEGGWTYWRPFGDTPVGGLNGGDVKPSGTDDEENDDEELRAPRGTVKAGMIRVGGADEEKAFGKKRDKQKRVSFKGRYWLKQKLEMKEKMAKALLDFAKAKAEAKKKGHELKKKKGKKNIKEQTKTPLIKGEDMRVAYADLVNKAIDLRAVELRTAQSKFFREQEARVQANLAKVDLPQEDQEEPEKGYAEKVKVSEVFDSKGEKTLTTDFILPFITNYAIESGKEALLAIEPATDFKTSPALQAFIKKRAKDFGIDVTRTTREALTRVLSEGISNGEGIRSLSARVAKLYGEFDNYRSERIARTETTAANGQGTLDAYRQSSVANGKEWITAGDDRVRDEHVALEGEIVGVDENFSNGLGYPQEVNCRCVLGPAFIEG